VRVEQVAVPARAAAAPLGGGRATVPGARPAVALLGPRPDDGDGRSGARSTGLRWALSHSRASASTRLRPVPSGLPRASQPVAAGPSPKPRRRQQTCMQTDWTDPRRARWDQQVGRTPRSSCLVLAEEGGDRSSS
jgi:hypothetical protein